MSTSPLRLTDDELNILFECARPLEPGNRDAFLQAVASALARHEGGLGVGLVWRTCRELQRRFYSAPLEETRGRPRTKNVGKYA